MVGITAWSFLVWVLLTWTVTTEQLSVGLGVSVACGATLAGLGPVPGPWVFLVPRRAWSFLVLTASSLFSIVRANVALTRLIWGPRRRISSGMVVLGTDLSTDAGVAALGLVTSLTVDDQLVDLDRGRGQLQYHMARVPESTDKAQHSVVTPIERRLHKLVRRPS